MVDIIILSYAKNSVFIELTNNCLESLWASEDQDFFNIFVVESNPNVSYLGVKMIHIEEPFNYNKFANIGVKQGKSEYLCVCNNDLIFQKGWATELLKHGFSSMSPRCPNNPLHINLNGIHHGFQISKHICGWCLFLKRSLWEQIGGFDEDFEFWYADNSYGEQLKKHHIIHYLVATSTVEHLQSQTLKTLSPKEIEYFTISHTAKFNTKFKRSPRSLNSAFPNEKNWVSKVINSIQNLLK